MGQLKQNKKLVATFLAFAYTKGKHNCNTRSARDLLAINIRQTFTYGAQDANTNAWKIGTDLRRKTQPGT